MKAATIIIVAIIVIALVVAFIAWLASRAVAKAQERKTKKELSEPLAVLRKRLADGEIDEEEFLERESALRDSSPVKRSNFGRRL